MPAMSPRPTVRQVQAVDDGKLRGRRHQRRVARRAVPALVAPAAASSRRSTGSTNSCSRTWTQLLRLRPPMPSAMLAPVAWPSTRLGPFSLVTDLVTTDSNPKQSAVLDTQTFMP